MKTFSKAILLITIITALAACVPAPAALPTPSAVPPTQPPTSLPQTDADVPRVSPADAKAALDRGEAILVDVRTVEAYAAEHIPGAVNGINGLDKSKWIITYCT